MVESISFWLSVCRSSCLSWIVFRLKTKEGLVKTSWKGMSLCNISVGSHNEGLMLYSVPHSFCVHVQEAHHYYTITHLLRNHPEDIHAEDSCNSGILSLLHRKWRRKLCSFLFSV